MVDYWNEETIRKLADNPPFDAETLELAYRIRQRQYLRMDAGERLDNYLDSMGADAPEIGSEEEKNAIVDDLVCFWERMRDNDDTTSDMWWNVIECYFK